MELKVKTMRRKTGEAPITKPSEGPKTIDELLLAIRPGLEASLSKIEPENHGAFLHEILSTADTCRQKAEFHFSPMNGVFEAICLFADWIWHNELRDILSFIYKRGNVQGELSPASTLKLLDEIGDEEIIKAVKSEKDGGIKQFLPKIRTILASDAVQRFWTRRSSKPAKR